MDDLPLPVLIARGQPCLSAREQVQGRHKLRLTIHQPFQCTWQVLGWELAVSSPHYGPWSIINFKISYGPPVNSGQTRRWGLQLSIHVSRYFSCFIPCPLSTLIFMIKYPIWIRCTYIYIIVPLIR
jgi:hypothetical protein